MPVTMPPVAPNTSAATMIGRYIVCSVAYLTPPVAWTSHTKPNNDSATMAMESSLAVLDGEQNVPCRRCDRLESTSRRPFVVGPGACRSDARQTTRSGEDAARGKFAIGYWIRSGVPLQPLRGATSTATSMVCLLPPSSTPLMGL